MAENRERNWWKIEKENGKNGENLRGKYKKNCKMTKQWKKIQNP